MADLRAATPSNGAELAVPDQEALAQNLDSLYAAMAGALNRQLKLETTRLQALASNPALRSPLAYMESKGKELLLLKNRMTAAQERILSARNAQFVASVSKLDAMSPLKVLSRGYAMALTPNGAVLRSVKQVTKGAEISIMVSDGTVAASVLSAKETGDESKEPNV